MKNLKCWIIGLVLFASGIVAGIGANAVLSTSIPETTPVPTAQVSVYELWEQVNGERAARALPALTLDPKLNASAADKCSDMVARDYWSHTAPDGTSPFVVIDKHTDYHKAGENLAFGFFRTADVITGWMTSPTHKANIVDPVFSKEGFAICESPNFTNQGKQVIVVQHFSD